MVFRIKRFPPRSAPLIPFRVTPRLASNDVSRATDSQRRDRVRREIRFR